MMKLTSCTHCKSFLPRTAAVCPHCGETRAARRKMPLALKSALAVGAGAVLAMTLSACYGAPSDPYMDSGLDLRDSSADTGVDSGP